MTQDYDINQLMAKWFLPKTESSFDSDYQATFRATGDNKAKRYSEYLREVCPAAEQESFAFVSIGAADGSEIDYVSQRFRFKKFIACEPSQDGAMSLQSLSTVLASKEIELRVLSGDIWEKRHEISSAISEWALSGVVVSAQSVLHELPYRSQRRDFASLFLQLISFSRKCIFLSSDPTGNIGSWPQNVVVSSTKLSAQSIYQLSRLIHQNFFPEKDQPELIGVQVHCDAQIALEVIYKLAYWNGNARLEYELEECLSKFPRALIQDILNANEFESTTSTWQNKKVAQSFRENFTVRAVNAASDLTFPETFVSIFANNLKKKSELPSGRSLTVSILPSK